MYRHEEFEGYPVYGDISKTYYNFLAGNSIEEMGEFWARESAYKQTSQYTESEYGLMSEQCAAAHYYLANFYQHSGNIREAVTHWRKLLEIEEEIFGIFSHDYENTLNNLGIALADNYQIYLGEGFLRLALALCSRQKCHEIGHTEFQLAQCLMDMEKTGRLAAWFKKIAEIATTNELKGKAYHSLAYLKEAVCGDYTATENYYQLALKNLKDSEDYEQLANTFYNYGAFLYFKRNKTMEAEQIFLDALKVQLLVEEEPQDHLSSLGMIYKALCRISLKREDDDQLLNRMEEWLETVAQIGHTSDLNDTFVSINNLLKEHGDIEKRYNFLNKLAGKYSYPQVQLELAYCARDMGRTEEAKVILMEAAPENMCQPDLKELFFILLDDEDYVEAEKIAAGFLEDPQLLQLVKTAKLNKKASISAEDVKGQVQSLLEAFEDAYGENDD